MTNDHMVWQQFQERAQLSPAQLELFKRYYQLLLQWNEVHNLTAITDLAEVLEYHFLDSILIRKFYDFEKCRAIADIGSGGGFPGIPLSILFPGTPVLLIEVTEKKCRFLRLVAQELGLAQVEVIQLDWRTFLRTTCHEQLASPYGLVCARASLAPRELVRMFQPSSCYRDATLVYWASRDWQPTVREQELIVRRERYEVGGKERRYVFFKRG